MTALPPLRFQLFPFPVIAFVKRLPQYFPCDAGPLKRSSFSVSLLNQTDWSIYQNNFTVPVVLHNTGFFKVDE